MPAPRVYRPSAAGAGTLQRAVITKDGLAADDYLYAQHASATTTPPAQTTAKMTVRKLKKSDVDYKTAGKIIENAVNNPVRNQESDVPVHMNQQSRLPMYTVPLTQIQPNMEYLVPAFQGTSLGASRLVVDVAGQRVYLSYHYGDQSTKEGKIPKWASKGKVSAFVELDADTWNLANILADALVWWNSMGVGQPGT